MTDNNSFLENDYRRLEYLAYNLQDKLVYRLFTKTPKLYQKPLLHSPYIVASLIRQEKQAMQEGKLVYQLVYQKKGIQKIEGWIWELVNFCKQKAIYPKPLYEILVDWFSFLKELGYPKLALKYYGLAFDLDITKFPTLACRANYEHALILKDTAYLKGSYNEFNLLFKRLYLVPDRNLIPHIIRQLTETCLLTGRAEQALESILKGLRCLYLDLDIRRYFVEKLLILHRRFYKVFLTSDISISNKFLFFLNYLHFFLDRRLLRFIGITRVSRFFLFGYLYISNYIFPIKNANSHKRLTNSQQINPNYAYKF